MGVFRLARQTWTLTRKDLSIVLRHQWLSTFLRAVALPIAYMFFIAYCRNFFLPPSEYGIASSPNPIRDLTTQVFNSSTSLGGRNRVVFVNNGFTGGPIEQLINGLTDRLEAAGAEVRILDGEDDLFDVCPSSLTGLSSCYGAVTFRGSPTEGPAGVWSYTARSDFGLGLSPYVNRDDNDAQVFVLPFIHAIDAGIAEIEGVAFPRPENFAEYPFTYETLQERSNDVQEFFMRALASYLAVTLFIGICGVAYHLPGHMSSERELGMSNLIDSMMFARSQSYAMIVRLVSVYLSFVTVYLPGWIGMGVIVWALIFRSTAASIVIPFHILLGLSLTGYAIFLGSFFRKSQLSGTTAMLLALILAVIAQFVPRTAISMGVLSCLFPPFAYTAFMIQLATWEVQLRAANLYQIPPFLGIQIPGYLFFVFMAVQIVVYPLLAAAVQWTLYGTASRHRTNLAPGDESLGLRISGVSKTFRPSWWRRLFRMRRSTVRAVNDLSLTCGKGHIVALLGANGSGKSTTLSTIAGTQAVTEGQIERDHASGLGYCPQSNVLWNELSVLDHIHIFSSLKAKGKSASELKHKELAVACDLEEKLKAKSKTLSGGQKRKLQLAMAFVEGSSMVCIDEVSSGLDPLSRRKIWNILLSERGSRSMLLTTHALDEADALADQINIMSKGRLIVEGTAPELKQRFGGGYRIVTADEKAATFELGPHRPYRDESRHLAIASTSSSDATQVAKALQAHGVDDVQVNGPTIEGVFIKVSEEFAEELSELENGAPPGQTLVHGPAKSYGTTVEPEKATLDLVPGVGTGFFRQTWILFRKRLLIFSRNWLPYLGVLIIPIVTAGMTTFYFLDGFDRLLCTRGELANNPRVLNLGGLEVYWGIEVPVGPPQQFQLSSLPPAYQPFSDRLIVQDTYQDFNRYIADNFRDVVPGGFWLDYGGEAVEAATAPLMAYRINGNLGYSALAKNVADSYLMDITINADFSTFALPFIGSTGDSLQLVLYIGFAMCCASAFFALYPTFERLSNIRSLHYSNGLRPAPLWLAYGLFDTLFVAVIAVVTISIFTSIADVWFAPSYLGIIFFLFGVASIFLAYIVSLFCTSQLAAFAFVAGGQAIFLLIYFLLYLVLLTFADAENLQYNLNTLQYAYGIFTPSGNLLRALLLALNQSQVLCRGEAFLSYPGAIDAYGSPILYLVLQIVFFYSFLVWYDGGRRTYWPNLWHRKRPTTENEEEEGKGMPEDVAAEVVRTEDSNDKLKVLHMFKHFGRNKVVRDVTFGVEGGEVMALLGPNGAGKTTTLSLIRGDIKPSSRASDVLISGTSVNKDRLGARRLLGVCPQFNTMDYMTVTEHLSFYARVRGVPDITNNVAKVMEAVGLSSYRDRMAGKLSGGNQRKLSLATAIIGNPAVLLLDEPSTGMDAVAMRVMWKAIRAISAGRAIVITTHSMEEASSLSHRTAIVDRRLLVVDGTSDVIRKHGHGFYHVHIALATGASTTAAEMDRVKGWVRATFPGAVIHDELFPTSQGQLRFQTSAEGLGEVGSEKSAVVKDDEERSRSSSARLVGLLDALESQKERLSIAYYTVSQATLEDVFLDIISRQSSVAS
ncbi:hypothetical protein MBLNU230_g3972t1 [Neophaeotheca triangularis]